MAYIERTLFFQKRPFLSHRWDSVRNGETIAIQTFPWRGVLLGAWHLNGNEGVWEQKMLIEKKVKVMILFCRRTLMCHRENSCMKRWRKDAISSRERRGPFDEEFEGRIAKDHLCCNQEMHKHVFSMKLTTDAVCCSHRIVPDSQLANQCFRTEGIQSSHYRMQRSENKI